MRERVKIAATALAILTVLGAGIVLATAAQSTNHTAATTAMGAAASGVVVVEANGSQTSARTVAKGITARALATNAFQRQDAAVTSGGKIQNATLLLTSSSAPNQVKEIAASQSSNSANAIAAALSTFAGTGAAGSLGDGGEATAAQFSLKTDSPFERSGVVVAADGTIFVADTGNSTIRRIASTAAGGSTEPGIVRSVAGRFGPVENVSLSEPLGLAIDRLGNLYIADRGANAVFELPNAASATPGTLAIVAHVASPSSIAVTQDGSKVFVASDSTGAVFVIGAASAGATGKEASRTVSYVAGFSESANACSSTTSAGKKICPAGLAVDPRGNLFVSDASGNQVWRVNAADGKTVTVASNFRLPGGIAADANGNLYVADQARAQVAFIPADDGQSCVTGASGALEICPLSNDFGSVVQGGTTSNVPFVLTNTTAAQITGLTYSPALPSTNPPVQPPSSPFIVQNTSCITTLAANASCTLYVTFSPNTTGNIGGSLIVSDENPQDTVSSTLTGSGTNYQLQLASLQGQSLTIIAGQTAQYNFTLIPDANYPYTGTVTIVCPANLPILAYCVGPSSPVTLMAGQNTNFSISIETTSRSGITSTAHVVPFPPARFLGPWSGGGRSARVLTVWLALAVAAAMAFLYAGLFAWRRNWRAALALVGIAAICAGSAACGGGSGSKIIVDGTPAGTSNLLVQATAQGTGRAFTVQMIVQQ